MSVQDITSLTILKHLYNQNAPATVRQVRAVISSFHYFKPLLRNPTRKVTPLFKAVKGKQEDQVILTKGLIVALEILESEVIQGLEFIRQEWLADQEADQEAAAEGEAGKNIAVAA